ncbi:MAG: hypothetical protein ABJB11_18485 [Ferruginibacter sp.]
MKRLFHFILSHSIFISFCAAALSLQTMLLLSLPINNYRLAFIFFATLSGYNAYWMISRYSFNKFDSLFSFFSKSKSSLLVMLTAVAGMIFCYKHLQLVMYNTVITFVFLILYAIPLLPIKQLHFTRKAGFVKTILLAFAWTMVTILIPLQIAITDMETAGVLIFITRFLFMLVLCIIFDKRDATMDKIRGLQSLATDISAGTLKYFIGIILLAYILISFGLSRYEIPFLQVMSLVGTGLFTAWVYIRSLQKRGYIFYYFEVDGLMFLSGLLTLLASI